MMVYCSSLQLSEDVKYMPSNKLSFPDALKELGVTSVTLNNWIYLGKIKVHRYKIGKRVYRGFDPEEIKRVKERIVSKRQPGKSILK